MSVAESCSIAGQTPTYFPGPALANQSALTVRVRLARLSKSQSQVSCEISRRRGDWNSREGESKALVCACGRSH